MYSIPLDRHSCWPFSEIGFLNIDQFHCLSISTGLKNRLAIRGLTSLYVLGVAAPPSEF